MPVAARAAARRVASYIARGWLHRPDDIFSITTERLRRLRNARRQDVLEAVLERYHFASHHEVALHE